MTPLAPPTNSRIAVLGLYRSGSSVTAGILHRLGIHMGKHFWGHNYEAYWLAGQLRSWWDEPNLTPQVDRELRVRVLKEWVEEREASSGSRCGAKHPLLALCAEDLLEAWGPETRFIWCHRSLDRSIDALVNQEWWEPEQARSAQEKLWHALQSFLQQRQHHKFDLAHLRAHPAAEIRRLAVYLGLDPSPQQLAEALEYVESHPGSQPAKSSRAASPADSPIFQAFVLHNAWNGALDFFEDGRFRGGHAGQHGRWTMDPEGAELTLHWERWPPSRLRPHGNGYADHEHSMRPPRDLTFAALRPQAAECRLDPPIGTATIHVSYRGQLGNNLFQFAAGRILSWHSGAPLTCRPLPGFAITEGRAPEFCPTDPLRSSTRGPGLDLLHLSAHLHRGGDVVIEGFHQQYDIYRPWKDRIRAEFATVADGQSYLPTTDDDLVVHARLADLAGLCADNEGHDLDAVLKVIESRKFERLVLITDLPAHPFIVHLTSRYRTVLGPGTKLPDFVTMMRARRLVLTPSTFGWWAAWLSDAHQIDFPRHHGVWHTRRCQTDLWVDDESRYVEY